MSDVKEFNCMNVKLGDIDAVVCMMDVKTLIDVQYIARRGVDQEPGAVQRVLNPVRVNAIYEYVLKGNIFYTPFILNWTNDEVPLQFDNNQLRFLSCAHSAQVLDGQHRIAGLMKAIDKMPEIGTKEVLVIMAQHLDTIDAAKIFLNINTEQKPVQKSLLYDLFGIVNQDDTKIPAVRAKDIAERLNLETDSPYYGYIKFPGNKRGTKGVDLSTVVNSLSLKLGKNSLIERYNIANLENQYAVFKNYFAAIKTSYDRENLWENRANPFLTNAGFYGAIEAFELIFQKCAQRKDFTQRAFEEEMQVSSLLRQSDLSKLEGKEQRKRVFEFLQTAIVAADVTAEDGYKF